MINWRHWHNEPYLVGGILLLGWLYFVFTGPLRGRLAPGAPYPRRQAWKFYGGLVLFYLAVGSPLDEIGERFLLSAHMFQHQLLIYPVAILFLLGLPDWLVRPVTAAPALRGAIWFLTRPLVCGAIYVIVFSTWHYSSLYQWALEDKLVHVFEHVMFLGAALFFWWPLLSPSREFPPARPPVQMLYLFCVSIAEMPAYAYVTFSSGILYPSYEFAPRIIPGFSAASDQLLAGTMMRLGGMAVEIAAFAWCFYRWYRAERDPS